MTKVETKMKTSQVLTRKMGEFDVLQRTSDGYFDANALLSQWNAKKGNARKNMPDFVNAKNTKEFLIALSEELIANAEISDMANFQPIKEIKGRMTKKGKTKDQAWMQPYLFIKFSMWINPRFEVKVIKFVYDQLIQYRNEAGSAYKEMSCAVAKLVDKSFTKIAIQNVARAVNHIVFGSHESEIRNKQADESKMRELFELERDVSKSINRKVIKNYEGLIEYLREVWKDKWQPKCLGS